MKAQDEYPIFPFYHPKLKKITKLPPCLALDASPGSSFHLTLRVLSAQLKLGFSYATSTPRLPPQNHTESLFPGTATWRLEAAQLQGNERLRSEAQLFPLTG